ncbi:MULTISPECIES: helix-turn-helix domain-containing protein [Actinoalloteichus]|uniref:DNA-binding protein, excisionase family n=1 Tax=Actinoalloteichus fjordicus TaxID=1612552 RepID=A0AAC9LGG4_9PSEU|nr:MULTISPECIES: helix-turn-helix domain-containing protein [Actinoalloteichus]APU17383.1 DNA-binding protein, excisionase family [Actinoalloteichus fjordicus]APU23467.1 DNA-binding protein, excisionase family [Actinoalloteichus sp. GBA129-24]
MTAVLDGHTVLPPSDDDTDANLRQLALILEEPAHQGEHAELIGPDGSRVTLPADLHGVLRDTVAALSAGLAVTIAPRHAVLTTQQAADLLHISRPTLIKLLEEEKIPYTRPGRHRRIRLADVLEYEEGTRQARRETLGELTHTASEDGTADDIDHFIRTR